MVQVPLPAEEIQLDADPIVLFLVMVLPNTVNLVGIIQKDVIGQYMTVLIHRIDVEEKPAAGIHKQGHTVKGGLYILFQRQMVASNG